MKTKKNVKIVFLSNPHLDSRIDKILKQPGFDISRHFRLGIMPSAQEEPQFGRGAYVLSFVKGKSLINRISKNKPDISCLGGLHAYAAGKQFGIKPVYVGCTAKGVEAEAHKWQEFLAPFLRERRLRRKSRRHWKNPRKQRK